MLRQADVHVFVLRTPMHEHVWGNNVSVATHSTTLNESTCKFQMLCQDFFFSQRYLKSRQKKTRLLFLNLCNHKRKLMPDLSLCMEVPLFVFLFGWQRFKMFPSAHYESGTNRLCQSLWRQLTSPVCVCLLLSTFNTNLNSGERSQTTLLRGTRGGSEGKTTGRRWSARS